MKRSLPIVPFFLLALHLSCDFQNPSDFEVPKWNINLTIPLLDAKYAFADIVDGKTIQIDSTDSSTIQIEFGGELPSDSIGDDFLSVPGMSPDAVNQEISVPTISEIMLGKVPIELCLCEDETIDLPVYTSALQPGQVLSGSEWNSAISQLKSESVKQFPIKVADVPLNSAFASAEITFLYPKKLVITGDDDDENNKFRSKITVSDFPEKTGLDSAKVSLYTKSKLGIVGDTLAYHNHADEPTHDWEDVKTTYLKNKELEDGTLEFSLSLFWTDPDPTEEITIPESYSETNKPTITLELEILLANPDSLVVVMIPNEPMIDASVLDLPSFSASSMGDDPTCSATDIYGGTLVIEKERRSKSNEESNVFEFGPPGKEIKSTLPFPVDFKMKFKNFHPPAGRDSVKYEAILKKGVTYEKKTIKIDSDDYENRYFAFKHSSGDANKAVEEFEVDLQINTPNEDYSDPVYPNYPEIGFSIRKEQDPPWSVGFGLKLGQLDFKTLSAKINCPFPVVEDTISGMPTGFTGMTFGGISLEFIFINEIRAPINMDLKIIGVTPTGESVVVPVIARIEQPAAPGDSAKTIIRLDKKGTTLIYSWFNDVKPDTCRYHPVDGKLVCDGWEDVPRPENSQTIIQLLAAGPEIIKVEAASAIDGEEESDLDLGAKITGSFQLIAPFEISVDSLLTFIPNQSSIIDEWKHETRHKLRNFISEALITSSVKNSFPIGGDISVLMSNRDIFPAGSSNTTLASWRDSLVELYPTKWEKEHTLEVFTNKCDDLMKNDGSYYVSQVIYDKNGCSDSTAYLVQQIPGVADTVISYIDTLFKIILPSPKDYYSVSNAPPNAVKLPGEQISTSGLNSSKMHLLTDIGKHYIRPSITLRQTSETVGEVDHSLGQDPSTVSFSLQDTISMQSYIVFQLQMLEGLTEKVQDELIITYPNGGEIFDEDSTYKIKWVPLGTNLTETETNKFVEIFTSSETEPEKCPSDVSIWKSIDGKKSNLYTDTVKDDGLDNDNNGEIDDKKEEELIGTPKNLWYWTVESDHFEGAQLDSVWIKICGSKEEAIATDCTKDICDMSRSWFTVKKEAEANSLSNLNKGRPNKKRASKGRKY